MKTALAFFLVFLAPCARAGDSVYGLTVKSIEGREVKLSQYAGKVSLIVNTASKCGYTPQFKALEEIYKKYKDRGFVVLGFPSNDFLHQDPGTNAEIKDFCLKNYGVSFPMFEKNPVKGKKTQLVYKLLKASDVGSKDGEIGWNFTKFLVGRDGQVAARYPSKVKPDDEAVLAKIEELLKAKPAKGR
jgi:glutathione peroxidase